MVAFAACSSGLPHREAVDLWAALSEAIEARRLTFSGAVLVARDGVSVVESAAGLADRATGRPNTVETRFNLGSVAKMFTGVAVAQLVQDGRLAFNDTIGKHLAGFAKEVADTVTLHHLLTHTSGLGDFMRGGYPEWAKEATTATELLPLVTGEALLFAPGARESYSNSGYLVLGAIVEAASGQPYFDYVRGHVFEPAGMASTDWMAPAKAGAGTAVGYPTVAAGGAATGPVPGGPGPASESGRPRLNLPPPPGPAQGQGGGAPEPAGNRALAPGPNPSGGAYSTVGDLLRFARSLLAHRLLNPAMTEVVLAAKVPMASGRGGVAYGFTDGTIGGLRVVGHGGGAPGIAASLDIYPDRGDVVAVLANTDGVLDAVRDEARGAVGRAATGR